jgi:hypothetical protein
METADPLRVAVLRTPLTTHVLYILVPFTITAGLVVCIPYLRSLSKRERSGSRSWTRPSACARLFKSQTKSSSWSRSVQTPSSCRPYLQLLYHLGTTRIPSRARLLALFHSVSSRLFHFSICLTFFKLPLMDEHWWLLVVPKVFG